MINVVTALGNESVQKKLERECVGNDIRFLESDFQTIDMLVDSLLRLQADVIVIHQNILCDAEQGEVFKLIRRTCPKGRIILILPGSRNQFVPEQISEYKDRYNVHDIIYEDMELDGAYFAMSVLKNGQKMEKYQEEKTEETEQVEKVVLNDRHISKPVFIGVIGTTHGSGVTTTVIYIARYLSLKYRVAVADLSKSIALKPIKNKNIQFMTDEEDYINTDVVIYDFGTPFDIMSDGVLRGYNESFSQKSFECFKNCDLKLCLCFSNLWQIQKAKSLSEICKVDDSYGFLFDKKQNSFDKDNSFERNDLEILRKIEKILIN